MKLTAVLILAACLHVSGRGFSQIVTYSAKNASVQTVFAAIEKQTGYSFFYNNEDLKGNHPISGNVKNQPLDKALDIFLKDQPFTFNILGKTIFIKAKPGVRSLDASLSATDTLPTPLLVHGRVTDSVGNALSGAVVKVKGAKRGAYTDVNGYFKIMAYMGDVLMISFVSYQTKEIVINSAKIGTISLSLSLSKLDDVSIISTGYQKIKKDQLTGAASSMNEEQYHQREAVTGNFLESLEGKIPGLVYNGQTGELTIRGVSSFDAVKQPLIVLDGFPTEIDLRTINPNDIVSISVLRDAAAASIYGVRASNGVIIVETRRGRSGKTVFNLRTTAAVQRKPDFSYLNYAPASEFVQLQRDYFNKAAPAYFLYQFGLFKMNPAEEILFGGTQLTVSNPLLTPDQINAKLAALGAYDNLKEYEQLFYKTRQARNINFDVSGGGERNTYMLGLNYIQETPVTRRSDNKQFNLSIANTFKISDRFNLDFKSTYTNSVDRNGNVPSYADFYPYEHLADANGNALAVSLGPGRDFSSGVKSKAKNDGLIAAGLYDQLYYPYRELTSNTNTSKGIAARFQGRLNTRITNWLSMDIGGNFETQNAILDQLQQEDAYNVRQLLNSMALKDASTGRGLFTNMPAGNILKRTNQKITNYTARGQLNVARRFDDGKHDFSGIFGIEQKRTLVEGYTTSYFGYDGQTLISKPVNMGALNATTTPAFTDVGNGRSFVSTQYYNQTETDRRFMSYYGQGTYIFKGKYVATGSFRIDQSNLFGVDPKYKNKPLWSAGLNWRLDKEKFIKQYAWIDRLQVRAATGFNGNVPSSNNGAFLILSTALNTTLNTPLTYNDVLTPENQSLRWETTKNYNLGLDYSIFKGRVSGSVDWYLKKTTDVFGLFDSDPTSGFNQYYTNTASIQNSGVEFLVNSLNIKSGKFEWNTQVTASFNHNKVLAVKPTDYAYSQLITGGTSPVVGLPIGSLFSYNYGGLNALGQPYVLDKNGNQKVLAFTGTNLVDVTRDDLIYNGTTTPKYVLGLNNTFTTGAFDISFLFMYYGGHVMRVEQPNPNNIGYYANNPLQGSSNYWKQPGDEKNTVIPGYVKPISTAPGYYQIYALYGYQYASQFVRKADYIRLRDVVITYNAKARFIRKLGLKNTQLRFQAQNAFRYTFSGNDIDPDAINRISGVRYLETQPFYSLTFSTNL